jgi:8-amino-7-oxononanoate synthase
MSWDALVARRLEQVASDGRWRRPLPFDALGPEGLLRTGPSAAAAGDDAGRPVVSFASNDYLGLSCHPAVVAAAHRALDRWGAGSGASRLVTGSRPVHHELERALAEHAGTAAAVCFPTGFAANLGVLGALAAAGGPGARILSDELNHASIVDGCRLSRAEVVVYRHGDVEHLDGLLAASAGPAVVVTDTVFSMDGDVAPLAAIADACRRHRAALVLDEAHAVLGPAVGPEVTDDLVVVRVGTMSKTLGSLGGFAAGPAAVADLLVNVARPYIFTTAPSPADAAAALAALGVLHSGEGDALRRRLAGHVARLAPGHPTPILPVVIGDEQAALDASARLLSQGLWVPAIRPPTVPPGTSRLRVTLSAAHTDRQVSALAAALRTLGATVGADAG